MSPCFGLRISGIGFAESDLTRNVAKLASVPICVHLWFSSVHPRPARAAPHPLKQEHQRQAQQAQEPEQPEVLHKSP